jgi:tape measure domain-containing protein
MNETVSFSVFLKDYFSKGVASAERSADRFADRAESDFKRVENASKHSAQNMGNSWTSAFSTVRNLAVTIGAGALIKNAIKAAGAFETTNIKFETFLGSADKAKEMIKELDAYSIATPFSPEQVNDAATTLLNFGVNAKNTLPILRQLGDISAGNGEKFSALSLVFGQVAAAGKLQGQDLIQFINAGFNPLNVLAQKTGKSYEYFRDKMEKGNFTIKDVSEAMTIATNKGGLFYNMSNKIAGSYEGKASTAIGNFNAVLRDLGKGIMPAVESALDSFNASWQKLLPVVKVIGETIGWIVKNIGSILTVLTPLLGVLATWYTYTKLVTLGQWALNVALTANPIGLVISGIAVLIGFLALAWNKSETFRGVILGVWEVMKNFASAVGDMFNSPMESIKKVFNGIVEFFKRQISPLFEMIQAIKEGRWLDAAKSGGKLLFNLSPAGLAIGAGKDIIQSASFKKGFAKGKDSSGATSASATPTAGDNTLPDFRSVAAGVKDTAETGKGKLAGVSGDSGSSKNLTIKIEKFGEINLSTTNISEGASEIREKLRAVLVDAVRDFELSY